MYTYSIRKGLEKELVKLAKKNPTRLQIIGNKIKEIISSTDASHYKNLRAPLNHLKRVHIENKTFVLVFSVNEKDKHITFEACEHHDVVYK